MNPSSYLVASALAACGLAIAGCHADAVEPVEPPSGESSLSLASLEGKMLALGRAHGCSLDAAISGVLCWGDNVHGQTNVPTLLDPTYVAAGGDVSCAVSGGRVRCWGSNAHRQLAVPSRLTRVAQVAVGATHVCALTTGGTVQCWGDNAHGQTAVPALRDVRQISAGARHTCALASGGVRCWGDDEAGQLDVPELAQPTAIAAGGEHSCAIDSGDVVCWGGDPSLAEEVPELTAPTAIAAGAEHSCAIDEGKIVHCWGPGTTDLKPRELTLPQQIAVGGAPGFAHACARHLQGVTCWGDDQFKQTRYDGAPLHLLYRAVADIAAPPELVWDILMDLEAYPEWNPYTVEMRSTLRVGDPMVMMVKMSPLLTLEQTEHIRVLEPGHKVCWGINTETPEFNSGERCQWLEPLPDGGTRYVTEDLIEGAANPLVTLLFGEAVRTGFESVARALKTRAESLAQ